eukprot:3493013-Prymnesium_polylepis.1
MALWACGSAGVMVLWRYDPVGVDRRYCVTRCGVIDPVALEPRPDVIQTSARRWLDAPDAGQTC